MNLLTQPLIQSGTVIWDFLFTITIIRPIWFWHLFMVWYFVPLFTYGFIRPYGWTPGSFTQMGLMTTLVFSPFAIYSAYVNLLK